VVDDAIIVVENVNRHLEEGMKPTQAAILAARELANPIIAMAIVLVAVYVPIGFLGGLTGALFTEFAFTLVGAVIVSSIVALTLSPMMCARLLKRHDPNQMGLGIRSSCWCSTQLRCIAPALRAPAPRNPQLGAGHCGLLARCAGQHLFPVRDREIRARTARGPGHHHQRVAGRAQLDAAAATAVHAQLCTRLS